MYEPIKKKSVQYPRFIPHTTQSKIHKPIFTFKKCTIKLPKIILCTSMCMGASAIIGYTIGKNLETTR